MRRVFEVRQVRKEVESDLERRIESYYRETTEYRKKWRKILKTGREAAVVVVAP